MANRRDDTFYQRLQQLFKSGPSVRRKIKGQDYKNYYDKSVVQNNLGYYGATAFKREASPFSVLGAYGLLDRMSRAAEFSEMSFDPIISTALDVYADECFSGDEHGRALHIFSDNIEIRKALEELFYDVVNIETDGRRWVRNLATFGDNFIFLEVVPNHGVVNVEPIPVNFIEREEHYDPEDPYAFRFKLLTHGGKILEAWQILHFRILSNDMFIPYGTSILESARRPYRQLILLEDAMLVYRVVRSPERRVFYIDVSGVHPNDIPTYMEAVKESIRGKDVIDRLNGRMDYRFNAIEVNDDYFLPTRPNSQTKIETLAGGQHVSATEDVEYIKNKMIASLKVPRAYLTYEDSLSSKATLASLDVRFSRSIANLQKIIITELNKLAIIHLFAKGFEGEDLIDFEIRLSNPSSVAIQQKLQLWDSKFDIAGKAKESELVDEEWIQKEILGLRMDDIQKIRVGREKDKIRNKTIEELELPKETDKPFIDPFEPNTNYNIFGPVSASVQPPKNVVNTPSQQQIPPSSKLTLPAPDTQTVPGVPQGKTPISANPTPKLDAALRKSSRRKGFSGTAALSMPDFKKMLDSNNRYTKDIYDYEFLKNPISETLEAEFLGKEKRQIPMGIPRHIASLLRRFYESTQSDTEVLDLEFVNEEQTNNDLLVKLEKELKNTDK